MTHMREREREREPGGNGQHLEGQRNLLLYQNFRSFFQSQLVPKDPCHPMLSEPGTERRKVTHIIYVCWT